MSKPQKELGLIDPELEKTVIGCVVQWPELLDEFPLTEDHFPALSGIWSRISELWRADKHIDLVSVSEGLVDVQRGLIEPLKEAFINQSTGAGFMHHAKRLDNLRIRRSATSLAVQMTSEMSDRGNDLEEVLDHAEAQILAIKEGPKQKDGEWVDSKAGMLELLDWLEAVRANKGRVNGISTGFEHLDSMIHGLEDGRVYVLAGRTSCGKSAMASQLALEAFVNDVPTAFFSLEMPREEILMR
ncbi:MAG: DnaB-like helicase C-terminal domain-containing protein, partial [Verrucomicrobiota bacterium]